MSKWLRDRGPRLRAIGATALAAAVVAALTVPVSATAATDVTALPCAPVDVVFARGSGQAAGDSGEAERFVTQVRDRFPAPLASSPNVYKLGTQSIGGHQYPATAVGLDHPIVSSGAGISGGERFKYGQSVDEGADELSAYIKARLVKCPDALFILAGYSQGAQVVGQTYNEALSPAERSHVVFNALFGDPKLYLPEGEGLLGHAPACKGDEHNSKWRRNVPNCDTDNGSLWARKPYLPSGWDSSTGLWCADHDFVCGSSKNLFDVDGHMHYAAVGGDIDTAAWEAVVRLQKRLPGGGAGLDTQLRRPQAGPTGLDVAFVIDSTGSMASYIAQAKKLTSQLSAMVESKNGRVALVEYRDAGDDFTARVLTGLNGNLDAFDTALAGISVAGGGDEPEAALHALKTTMLGLDWRAGATKAAIILTDAGYHDPDTVDGTTLQDVAALSLSIDPVNVYPVISPRLESEYAALAEATTGQVIADDGDTAAALTDALTRVQERPVALLPLSRYGGDVGSTMTFDGSQSYSTTSTIASWDWDFDGDGTFEVIGGNPVVTHTYDTEFDGFVQLRVTDANGLVANVSAPVKIGPPEPPTTTPATTVTVSGTGTIAALSWEATKDPSQAWAVTVDGIQVGLVEPSARAVSVTDIERDADVVFGVAPLTTGNELGEEVTATLAAASTEPTPTPTVAPTPTPTSTPTVTPTPPNTSASVRLSAPTLRAGETLTVSGSGFTSGSKATITLHSTPTPLATAAVSEDGTLRAKVTIPTNTNPGPHRIEVTDGKRTAAANVTIQTAQAGPLVATGGNTSDSLPLGVAAGAAALAAGFILLIVVRARRRRE